MEIQFRALRDALDQAGRTAQTAEEATLRARNELHAERTKSSCFQFKIEDLTKKLDAARKEARIAREEASAAREDARVARERAEAAKTEAQNALETAGPAQEEFQQLIEENKRLRTNVGDLCRERDELKKMYKAHDVDQKDAAPATMVIGFEMLRPELKDSSVTIG